MTPGRTRPAFFRTVPCGDCTACCRGNSLAGLVPEMGDDLSVLTKWTWQGRPGKKDVRVLDRKENGDCIYLEPHGCEVYEHRPAVCRAFDCRLDFLRLSKAERSWQVRRGLLSPEIHAEGFKRLKSLSRDERLAIMRVRRERLKGKASSVDVALSALTGHRATASAGVLRELEDRE